MLNGAHQRPGGHGDVERVAGREAAALGHRSDALHGGGDIVGSAAGNTSVDAAEYADTSSHSHTRPKAPTPDSAAPWQPTSRPESIGDDHGGASRRAHPGVAPSSGDADTAHSQWEHSAGAAVRTRGVGPHGLHRRGNATRDHGGSPVSVTKSSGQQGGRHGSMFSGSRAPVVNSPSRHASAVALVHGDASPGGWMPWFGCSRWLFVGKLTRCCAGVLSSRSHAHTSYKHHGGPLLAPGGDRLPAAEPHGRHVCRAAAPSAQSSRRHD